MKYDSTYELYLLHSRADRVMRSLLAERLETHEVTIMEWLLLGTIYRGPSSGMSMSSLAEELDVTLPQITALISGLVKKRLIKQKTQKQDRRSRHALTTQKGRDVFEKIDSEVQAANQQLFSGLVQSEINAYTKALETISSYSGSMVDS